MVEWVRHERGVNEPKNNRGDKLTHGLGRRGAEDPRMDRRIAQGWLSKANAD
jgi:hypothetical protein